MKDFFSNLLKVSIIVCLVCFLILFNKYINTIERKNRFVYSGEDLVLDSKTGAVYLVPTRKASSPDQIVPPVINY